MVLTSGNAEAWWWSSSKPAAACDTQVLEVIAVEGINPAGKTIGVYNDGSGRLWWKTRDNATWLSTWPTWGSSTGEVDSVKVSINSKSLAPGEYDATITVSNAWSRSDYVTVQVHLTVVEPDVKGPIMIGMEGIWPWSPDNEYKGTSASLLLGPGGMEDLSNAGVEIKDCFELALDIDLDAGLITGGTLSGSGDIPSGNILGGQVVGLEAMLGELGALLGDNYIVMFLMDTGEQYAGMLLTDIDGLLNGIPEILDLLGSTSSSSQEIEAVSQGLTIPLGPIMELLPKLLPLMEDLLPVLLPIIEPIASLIPPVIIVMPADLMLELMELIMP
jgi:hypothetical protein